MRSNWFAMISAAEAALVLLLMLLAAWQFWEWVAAPGQPGEPVSGTVAGKMPSIGSSHLIVGLLVSMAVYGLLQVLRRSELALWLLALLVILPQLPAVWSHNRLVWEKFMGVDTPMGMGHSPFMAGLLFLLTLVGLLVLHRVIALRKLGRLLVARRVGDAERETILTNEAATMGGVVSVALAASVLLVLGGTVLGRAEWLTNAVPWTVVTIGGGASLLLLGFIAVFLRGVRTQEEQPTAPGE